MEIPLNPINLAVSWCSSPIFPRSVLRIHNEASGRLSEEGFHELIDAIEVTAGDSRNGEIKTHKKRLRFYIYIYDYYEFNACMYKLLF
jgi:hypothetical protein